MAKKVYEEENIRAIADKIREKTGSDTTYKTSEMPDGITAVYEKGYQVGQESGNGGYDEGYEAGQKDYNEMLWNSMGYETQWFYTFAGHYWNDTTFNPPIDLIVPYTSGLFFQSKVTDLKGILERNNVKLDFSNATRLNSIYEQSTVTRSPEIDTRKCIQLGNFLYSANNLVSVDKVILKNDGSQTVSNLGFKGCSSLRDIVFEGVWGCDLDFSACVALSDDSVESIISALKDLKTYKTYTYSSAVAWDNVSSSASSMTFTVTSNNSDDECLYLSGVDENNQSRYVRIQFYQGTTDEFYHLANCPLADLDIKNFTIKPVEGAEDIACEYEFTYVAVDTENTVTKTLTFHADVKERISADFLKIATDKGWVIA